MVYKCQYFGVILEKPIFDHIYIHISKGRNSVKNCLARFFFYRFRTFQLSFIVFCVVFNCQYFCSYFRKTHFWPLIYIFQRAVTHLKIVRLTRFFFICSEHSNYVFLFFESYHFQKIMKRKCQKTEFRSGHLGFLAAILDWQWGIFNPVFYSW